MEIFKYLLFNLGSMADKKKKVPKHIEEFFKRDKKVNMLLEGTKNIHSDAYSKGIEVITDKKTGLPDHEMLEDIAVQDKMIDKMIDHYKSEAVKKLTEFKGKDIKAPEKGTMEEDMFLQKYIGVTRSELTRILRSSKSKYTQKAHEELRDKLVKEQGKALVPLRHAHLDKKHIGDVLKYTGVAKHFDADNIEDVEHIVGLLDLYKAKGEISLSDLAQTDLPKVYFKKEAQKEMKDLKKKYKTPA